MLPKPLRLVLAGCVLSFAVTAPVQASTIESVPLGADYRCLSELHYRAAAGEFNQVHVEMAAEAVPPLTIGPFCPAPAELVLVKEVYATIHAGRGCNQVTNTSAVCVTAPSQFTNGDYAAFFDLGDRDDLLSWTNQLYPGAVISGGLGHDIVDSVNGHGDAVSCGAGTDEAVVDPSDVVEADCERVPQPLTADAAGGTLPPPCRSTSS
jgi:hypothetical protein